MRATVRVVSPAAFKAWLAAQKPNGTPPIGIPPTNAAQPGVPGDSTPVNNPKPPSRLIVQRDTQSQGGELMAIPAKLRAPGWYRAALFDVLGFAFASA